MIRERSGCFQRIPVGDIGSIEKTELIETVKLPGQYLLDIFEESGKVRPDDYCKKASQLRVF